MGLLDTVKAAAGPATTKAKEGVAAVQTKRKLNQAYGELGQTTFELVQQGELSDPRLSPAIERIRAVKAQLEQEQRREEPPSWPPDTGRPPETPPLPPSAPGTPSETPPLPPR